MAVSIVEVESQRSVIQYGHMLRLQGLEGSHEGNVDGGGGGGGGGEGEMVGREEEEEEGVRDDDLLIKRLTNEM